MVDLRMVDLRMVDADCRLFGFGLLIADY